MLEQYSLEQMAGIWDEENHFQTMLEVEICAAEAMAQLGNIPADAAKNIREAAAFDRERIAQIQQVVKNDVIAFLTSISEILGENAKYVHLGMTASDVIDTTLAIQMRDSVDLLIAKLRKLHAVLEEKAQRYKYTLMIGRTHGIHAEPLTFGLKMALWIMEVDRNIERLINVKERVAVGMISGPAGTFATVDPKVEEYACRRLGLKPEPVSTQIVQRDRHAELLTTLAVVASSMEKFATELRNLQRTEILEVEEAFDKGQKGSTAMPHKKNPIMAETVAGLSRVVRGNALAGLEDVALWHERDQTHAPTEHFVIPQSCILLDYMIHLMTLLMTGLIVHEDRMQENLNITLGLIFSQRVLLALVAKGLSRETAYEWVQRNALESWETKTDFAYLVSEDADISRMLTEEEIEELFDYNYHLKNIDYIFSRAGL